MILEDDALGRTLERDLVCRDSPLEKPTWSGTL